MSSTQFVEMYHPLIASTVTSPVQVALQSVDDHAARGWLLVDPEAVLPDPETPYYTKAAADSRFALIGSGGGSAPDATASIKGLVQLAGDLGGTAAAPTVPGLAGKANSSHTHPVGELTATGAKDSTTFLRGDNTWAVPPGGGGSAAPDATTTVKGLVQLAGDLAGTAAAPTVPGLTSKAPTSRTITAGTGLTGGGDLSADRSFAVAYGTTAGTAVQGNDTRVVADQAAATASIRTLGTGAQQAKPGNYQPTAANISDSTTVGRSVLTAIDAAAARTALGAGTSSLALGTTSSTAKAGDYAPPAASETVAGVVELATAAETTTGTDNTRAVHPAGLKVELDKKAPLTGVEGIKVHDLTAGGGTRPTGYARIRWVGGTTRPTNMVTGDIWEHDA